MNENTRRQSFLRMSNSWFLESEAISIMENSIFYKKWKKNQFNVRKNRVMIITLLHFDLRLIYVFSEII